MQQQGQIKNWKSHSRQNAEKKTIQQAVHGTCQLFNPMIKTANHKHSSKLAPEPSSPRKYPYLGCKIRSPLLPPFTSTNLGFPVFIQWQRCFTAVAAIPSLESKKSSLNPSSFPPFENLGHLVPEYFPSATCANTSTSGSSALYYLCNSMLSEFIWWDHMVLLYEIPWFVNLKLIQTEVLQWWKDRNYHSNT